MKSSDRQRNALQVIFSFFLALMATAFIGVGVHTFYPEPEELYQGELQSLFRQQQDIEKFRDPAQITPADREKLLAIQAEIRTLEDKQQAYREPWARNTSIILIAFATLLMALSLVRAEQLAAISNGLLLGGLFTMLYGTGWVIATGTSRARFLVLTLALAVTLALGYLKFVRRRAPASPLALREADAAGREALTPPASDLEELAARIAALEERLAEAAAALALGGDEERRG